MGWSNATVEGKTAVALSNLTGDIYSVRAQRPAWKQPSQGGNVGVQSQTWLFPAGLQGEDSCEPERCDCARKRWDQRGSWGITVDILRDELPQSSGLGYSHQSQCSQLNYFKPSLLKLARDSAIFSHFIAFDVFTKSHKASVSVSTVWEAKSPLYFLSFRTET